MSGFTAIILLLTAESLGGIFFTYLTSLVHKRADAIITGVVNGVPVSLESRWLFFLHDYLGCVFGATFFTFVLVAGFLGAAQFASDSSVRDIAHLCAALAGFAFVFNLLFSLLWSRHFVSLLRRAGAGKVSGFQGEDA